MCIAGIDKETGRIILVMLLLILIFALLLYVKLSKYFLMFGKLFERGVILYNFDKHKMRVSSCTDRFDEVYERNMVEWNSLLNMTRNNKSLSCSGLENIQGDYLKFVDECKPIYTKAREFVIQNKEHFREHGMHVDENVEGLQRTLNGIEETKKILEAEIYWCKTGKYPSNDSRIYLTFG